MTMKKPCLRKLELSTAAISTNFMSSHPNRHSSTLLNKTTSTNHPTVTPFQTTYVPNKPTLRLPNSDSRKNQPNKPNTEWVDTKDIQLIIDRSIETDIEQSIQRNFGTQRYFYGPERVCAERTLPIPDEIKPILKANNERPNHEKLQFVYGYLSYAHAVYYIIGRNLYVFKVKELKKRLEEGSERQPSDSQSFLPVKIGENCRKIHQLNFMDNFNGRNSFQIPSKKALVFEYPYHLQIVSYNFEEEISQSQSNSRNSKPSTFSVINLRLKVSIESERAEFITLTPSNSLLYIDEKGLLVNCVIVQNEGKFTRRVSRQSFFQCKSLFISKNRSFFQAAKALAFQISNLSFSLHLSKRKNIALVYDQRRSRVYTLTLKGDRSTAVQQLKREINVYQFTPQKYGNIKSLLKIPEQELLLDLGYDISRPSIFIENILKAEPDYHQQASLIVLLSNGIKVYLEVLKQSCKARWMCSPPSFQKLRQKIDQKSKSLFEMTTLKPGKDTNIIINKKWGQKFQVDFTKNTEKRVSAFFNDRSMSIGLIKSENRLGMYLTLRKNYQKSDTYDVFEVNFKNDILKKRSDSLPTENQIFQTKDVTLQTITSEKISALEAIEAMREMINLRQYRHPKPITEGSHQLLRQVHHGPRFFTYLSNKFIATFTLVRPIDVVYYFVTTKRDVFCQNFLHTIVGVQISQISCMLLQIYSAPKQTSYFISKNYIDKIDEIVGIVAKNAEKSSSSQEVNSQGFMRTLMSKQKKKQQNESEGSDRLIEVKEKGTQDFKMNIRKLFANFSNQQKLHNQNVFEKIFIQSSKKSSEEINLDLNFSKLKKQEKIQAKNCLIYIGRVLYPFWNAKLLMIKDCQPYLFAISKKVKELEEIVKLLKLQANEFWMHLNVFLQKLQQIIEIFIYLPKLPQKLTLSEAMEKDNDYFEPFIFEAIQYNYDSKIIRNFQNSFPLYLSQNFITLVRIYENIKNLSNVQAIQRSLNRLDSYPKYFIDYLKIQKPFFDHASLTVKDKIVPLEEDPIEISNDPFVKVLPFYFSKVRDPTVKMSRKFTYLNLAKNKLQQQRQPRQNTTQVVDGNVIARLQKEFDEIYKCLKFQEQCKNTIQEILEQQMESNSRHGTNQRGSSGFLNNIVSKFTDILGSGETQNQQQNLSRKSYQAKRKVREQNRALFDKLDYLAIKRQDFEKLIQPMESPYLHILYTSVFWNSYLRQADLRIQMEQLESHYKDLVRYGYRKFGNILIAQENNTDQRKRYSEIIFYVKTQVANILDCLNSTQTELRVSALYNGLTEMLSEHSFTFFSVQKNLSNENSPDFLSIPTRLVELGFKKHAIADHVISRRLIPVLGARELSLSNSEKQKIVNKWVYEWFMLTDMAIKYKKDDMQRLLNYAEDFKKLNAEILNTIEVRRLKEVFNLKTSQLHQMINRNDEVII